MTTIQSTSQISPATERVYHQSNLLGDWKGTSTRDHQPIEFKVINIRGSKAQVEYTHNGHTERGFGSVDGGTITFGNVTIGTRNGSKAAFEFSASGAKWSAILDKQAAPAADTNKLVGSWAGYSSQNGHSASFTVVSISGKDAQVRYTLNGVTHQGTGTVYKNTVMFDGAQVTSDDGKSGHVVFQDRHQTLSVPVTKLKTSTSSSSSSSSVNKLA
jgi:hypothetical protein